MALQFGEPESIDIELIDDSDEGQARAETREWLVAEYVADMEAGDEFPPILLVKLCSDAYAIADGHHRLRAHKRLGREKILACVSHEATAEDALIYGATEASRKNAARPSRADKRRFASILLQRPDYAALKDLPLGRLCGCSHTSIASYRKLPLGKPTASAPKAMAPGKSYQLVFDDGQHGRVAELLWNSEFKDWELCHAVAACDSIAEDGPDRFPVFFWNEQLEGGRHFFPPTGVFTHRSDGAARLSQIWRLVEVVEFVAEDYRTDEGQPDGRNYRGGDDVRKLHYWCNSREGFRRYWSELSPEDRIAQEEKLRKRPKRYAEIDDIIDAYRDAG